MNTAAAMTSLLPPPRNPEERATLFAEIAHLIGEVAARQLIERFGGRRVYVPNRPEHDDHMVRTVGLAAALKLADRFGGERLFVPHDALRGTRRAEVRELRRRGLSISAIAHRVRVTERYVYKVLAEVRTHGQ